MATLTEIGLKYNTDKAYYHLFTDFYDTYFVNYKHRKINILEIGIDKGASLLMLKEYFPEATIHAIDIHQPSVDLKLGENIHTYLCSQDDFIKLDELFRNIRFDIIIDDGSHLTSHQQKSLGFLFPYLNANGIYVCEDLHTSYRAEYVDTKQTTLDILKNYKLTRKIDCDLIANDRLSYINDNITDVCLYERTKNALKCYNCKYYNYNDVGSCIFCSTNLSPTDKSITSVLFHR